MADFNGPYDEDIFVTPPMPTGRCPTNRGIKSTSSFIKGPGYRGGTPGSKYSSGCFLDNDTTVGYYLLHHIEINYTSQLYLNTTQPPNTQPNLTRQLITRMPVVDTVGTSYDTFTDSDFGLIYHEWLDIVVNPDGTWNYIYDKYDTYTYWVYFSGSTYEGCPSGTVYNPNTGTCDVLPGYEWDPNEGKYVVQVPLPELPIGIGHPPTYPPNEDLNCPPCYIYDAELNLCVYNPLEAGCEDLPINCVPVGGCVIPESVVLVPGDLDKILPPGYLESGALPVKLTGKPLDSIFEPIEPTFDPDTGECIILDNCE